MSSSPKHPGRPRTARFAVPHTSQSIAEQTKAFLKAGGKITKVEMGVCSYMIIKGDPEEKHEKSDSDVKPDDTLTPP